MKKFMILAALMVMLTACTAETQYGECIGVVTDPEPGLVYEYDVGNIVVAVILSETIIVPLIVVLDELKCPVAKRVETE